MRHYNYSYIGKRLKRRRLELGLSIEKLAACADLPPGYIKSVEAGNISERFTGIVVLALELGIEPKELFAEGGDADPGPNVVRIWDRKFRRKGLGR